MATKINWSKYITHEAIYRYWYILENNNFKHAIKKAQKDAKMNYAGMHNALYSGLYYPSKPFDYNYRTIKDIRAKKGISGAIANYMDRAEILRNIHAMYECADYTRVNAPFGYNAKLFAKEFFNIGVKTIKSEQTKKINPKLVMPAQPSSEESTPNVPQRYRLAKSFAKSLRTKGNTLVLSFYEFELRKEKYVKAYNQYIRAKKSFENLLKQHGNEDQNSISKLEQSLNAGFYKTIIPFFGFDIDKVLTENFISGVVKIQELEGNAKKFALAKKALEKNKKLSFTGAMEKLKETGEIARNSFIKEHRTFPECFIGFLNTFCDMLAKVFAFDNELLNAGNEKDIVRIADKLITTIKKLSEQYQTATDLNERREVEEQIKKIQKAVEDSNEHNI